jgi:hypothetical protein
VIYAAMLVGVFFLILHSFFFSGEPKSFDLDLFLPALFLVAILGVAIFLVTKDRIK